MKKALLDNSSLLLCKNLIVRLKIYVICNGGMLMFDIFLTSLADLMDALQRWSLSEDSV